MESTIKEAYFHYLVECANFGIRDMTLLLRELHRIEFYSLIPNDENRAEDGKMMREMFAESHPEFGNYDDIQGPCSVLEMLEGLAYRMSYVNDETFERNFLLLITNLGLDLCTDFEMLHYPEDFGPQYIREKVDKMLRREYNRKGKGGLFPLKFTKVDQRKVEIWYQMMAYLNENASLFDLIE